MTSKVHPETRNYQNMSETQRIITLIAFNALGFSISGYMNCVLKSVILHINEIVLDPLQLIQPTSILTFLLSTPH